MASAWIQIIWKIQDLFKLILLKCKRLFFLCVCVFHGANFYVCKEISEFILIVVNYDVKINLSNLYYALHHKLFVELS